MFVCFTYLEPVCLFFVFFVFLMYFLLLFCVVSTSARDCLERLVSEMTYYVSRDIKLNSLTHSKFVYFRELNDRVSYLLKCQNDLIISCQNC